MYLNTAFKTQSYYLSVWEEDEEKGGGDGENEFWKLSSAKQNSYVKL